MVERRRRRADKERRKRSPYFGIPYRQLRNSWPPYEIVGPERIEEIHQASMHILENTGIRFQNAFYPPFLFDRRNFGAWQAGGSQDTARRAHQIWQEVLAAYEPPPMEAAHKAALQDFVARRAVALEKVDLYG